VNDHRIDADVLEQDDVQGKGPLQRLVRHGMAAVLDDDGLAAETPDVR